MLDTGEHTAPVTTVQSLVNNSVDFYINFVAAENSVVDATKQIEKPALFSHRRLVGAFVSLSPGFGLVRRHVRSLIQRLRRLPSKIDGNRRNPVLCRLRQSYGSGVATS